MERRRQQGRLRRSPSETLADTLLPFRYGTVFVKHSRHRARATEWVFRERLLRQIKSKARLLGQWESTVHHSHRRKSQPFLPDLVRRTWVDLSADFLHDEVRHRGIHMQGGQAADRAFAGVRRHRDARNGGHLRYLPKSRDAAYVIDVGLENID